MLTQPTQRENPHRAARNNRPACSIDQEDDSGIPVRDRKALRRARIKLDITQQEAADRIGKSRMTISKLENRGRASIATLRAYARLLGVDVHLLED